MAFTLPIRYAFTPELTCGGTTGVCYAATSAVTVGDYIYKDSGLTSGWTSAFYVLFEFDSQPYGISLISAGYVHSRSSYDCNAIPISYTLTGAFTASGACSGTEYTVYSSSSAITTGVFIFEDSGLTIPYNNSFYVLFDGETNPYQMAVSSGEIILLTDTVCVQSNMSIYLQPEQGTIHFCRSPIVYRFNGCYQERTYTFNFYIGTTTTPNLIYASINRKPDTNYGITIDVASLLRNYMKSNLDYDNNYAVYFRANMLEYNGTTLLETLTGYTATAMLGYVEYSSGGTFNNTFGGEGLMNTIPQNTKYWLPNSTDNGYFVSYRPVGTGNYVIKFKTTTGYNTTLQVNMPGPTNNLTESRQIPVGFYNFYPGQTNSIDVNQDISLEFRDGTTTLSTYLFTPKGCDGNTVTPIRFLNKYGAWEIFFCQGRIDENLMIEFETYKHNKVDYTTMSYEPKFGSYHKSFVQGKTKYSINTGWLDDAKNANLKELLMSEYVLINDLPFIITDKDVKYKTNRYEKMVNYVLIVEKAYDEINNII